MLLSSEMCCVPSEMLPLAIAGPLNSTSQPTDPTDTVNTFISLLASNVLEIPKNKMCGYKYYSTAAEGYCC